MFMINYHFSSFFDNILITVFFVATITQIICNIHESINKIPNIKKVFNNNPGDPFKVLKISTVIISYFTYLVCLIYIITLSKNLISSHIGTLIFITYGIFFFYTLVSYFRNKKTTNASTDIKMYFCYLTIYGYVFLSTGAYKLFYAGLSQQYGEFALSFFFVLFFVLRSIFIVFFTITNAIIALSNVVIFIKILYSHLKKPKFLPLMFDSLKNVSNSDYFYFLSKKYCHSQCKTKKSILYILITAEFIVDVILSLIIVTIDLIIDPIIKIIKFVFDYWCNIINGAILHQKFFVAKILNFTIVISLIFGYFIFVREPALDKRILEFYTYFSTAILIPIIFNQLNDINNRLKH